MIEKLYDEVISKLRKYVNSIDRQDVDSAKVVEKFLENLISRIEYVTNIDIFWILKGKNSNMWRNYEKEEI